MRHAKNHRAGQPYWMDGKGNASSETFTSFVKPRRRKGVRYLPSDDPRKIALNQRRIARGLAPL